MKNLYIRFNDYTKPSYDPDFSEFFSVPSSTNVAYLVKVFCKRKGISIDDCGLRVYEDMQQWAEAAYYYDNHRGED